MKNLLIYTGPNHNFNSETQTLVKIQIDNSINLGWSKKDIILVTDFPYSYNGIKSQTIKDGVYYQFDLTANKIAVVLYMLKNKMFGPDEIYWCHDFDAFQNYPINEKELNITKHLGLTHYTYKPEWQLGSFFFQNHAIDIFTALDQQIRLRKHLTRNDEKELTKLIQNNHIDNSRYKRLNSTYNFTKRNILTMYRITTKPIKVLHFHPADKDAMMSDTALNIFMYGKNRLKIPLMSDGLIKIFKQHGIS